LSKPSPPPTGGSYAVVAEGALCCATVRDFIVIGGLNSDRYSIRWCAIGDPTSWPTPDTAAAIAVQAGTQVFPSKFGWVTGLAGNDFYMYIFQERGITKGTYVGGDVVFSFDIFEEDRGCERQGLLTTVDDTVFFRSDRGFHRLDDDVITDIGFGKVDDTYV